MVAPVETLRCSCGEGRYWRDDIWIDYNNTAITICADDTATVEQPDWLLGCYVNNVYYPLAECCYDDYEQCSDMSVCDEPDEW